MNSLLKYLLFAIIALVCFTVAYNYVPQVQPKQAKEIQRIVSLAPSVTESLFALGYGDKVVGVSNYCMYPPSVQNLPRIGALDDPNFEAIVRLQPDLVISSSERPQEYLSKLGINFLAVKQDRLDEILPSLQILDQLLGNQGQAFIQKWQTAFTELQAKQAKNYKVLISIMREAYSPVQSVYAVGNDGYFSEIINFFGSNNVYKGKLKFPILNKEALIQLKPDLIIDLLPPKTELDLAIKDWQNIKIPAVEENRILLFADESALVPGPRTIDFMQKLADFL